MNEQSTVFPDVAAWPDQNSRATIGHNRPPLDEEAKITFREELLKDRPDFLNRLDDMEAAADRVRVTDDDTLGKAADFIKMMRKADQHVDAAHKAAKQPYLDAGRAVDGEKNVLRDRIDAMRRKVQPKADRYFAEREAAARAERERIAAEQRRAAAEAEAAAQLREEAADTNDAEAIEQVPIAPAPVAAAPRDEPVRSDAGTAVSGRSVWNSEVTDYAAAFAEVSDHPKVREAIDKAVAQLVKAGKRTMPGVRIYETTKAIAR